MCFNLGEGTRVSARVCTRCASARRGQDGERAEERKLTRRLCRDFVSLVEASRLSGSFRLSARRALALSGRTQYLPRRCVRKIIVNLLSKQTGVGHTRCTSLARPWMGYAPKKFAENKHHSIEIMDTFSWGEGM